MFSARHSSREFCTDLAVKKTQNGQLVRYMRLYAQVYLGEDARPCMRQELDSESLVVVELFLPPFFRPGPAAIARPFCHGVPQNRADIPRSHAPLLQVLPW